VPWHKKDVAESKFFVYLSSATCLISGFRREVAENCALLGYYAAISGNFLATFRDNLSVPSSGVKNKKINPEVGTR
jgi:hypothetical protein